MSTSSAHEGPGNGDVIVRRTTDASRRYTVGTLRQPAQFICRTREEAVARATSYAAAHGVDVWSTRDGKAFTPAARTSTVDC
jgi:ketosteroid isomerase-like protein